VSHPLLRARVESLLGVVEDAGGDLEKADAAERRVIEELRQMGNEVLTEWAQGGIDKCTAQSREDEEVRSGGKKLHWHTTFGEIEVEETLLQRVLADFGADHAFGRVPGKLREHYGIGACR